MTAKVRTERPFEVPRGVRFCPAFWFPDRITTPPSGRFDARCFLIPKDRRPARVLFRFARFSIGAEPSAKGRQDSFRDVLLATVRVARALFATVQCRTTHEVGPSLLSMGLVVAERASVSVWNARWDEPRHTAKLSAGLPETPRPEEQRASWSVRVGGWRGRRDVVGMPRCHSVAGRVEGRI